MGHQDSLAMITPGTPFLITPSDTVNFHDTNGRIRAARGLSFGTAGAISLVDIEGNTVVIPSGALAAGVIHSIRCRRINVTGTTASDFVGYF